MSQIDITFLLSLTAVLPVITGAIRYRNMDKSYFPFIWVFVFITISEISRYILVKNELYTPYRII